MLLFAVGSRHSPDTSVENKWLWTILSYITDYAKGSGNMVEERTLVISAYGTAITTMNSLQLWLLEQGLYKTDSITISSGMKERCMRPSTQQGSISQINCIKVGSSFSAGEMETD